MGGDWNLAAENVYGYNTVLWEDGYDGFWFSHHDDQWAFNGNFLSILDFGKTILDNGMIIEEHVYIEPEVYYQSQLYKTETNFNIDLDNDGIVGEKPVVYSTIESEGNITLVKDEDNFGYAQDASGNKLAITYDGEHIKLGMWGGEWNFLAAENINGHNTVLWKDGNDSSD